VPPELLVTALGALRLAILFVTALFLPLLLQFLLLYVAGWAFSGLAYRVSSTIASLLDLIGTPVHELSHAVGFLITFCGVDAIKLLIDELGYAFVAPKRLHILGRIVSGLAPLFGGMLLLWLTAVYIIPGFEVPTVLPPQLSLDTAASLGTVLKESMDYLGRFLQTAYHNLPGLQWGNWRTYIGLYIALSVGIGIAPSTQDFKIFVAALPTFILLILVLFAWLYLSGDVEATFSTVQQGLFPPLLKFSTAVTYAFVLTSLGVLIFLPLRLLQRVRAG
jgi:hypothetical protein